MLISEVLEKSLQRLRSKGWCKGTFQDMKGSYCSRGAIKIETWNSFRELDGGEHTEKAEAILAAAVVELFPTRKTAHGAEQLEKVTNDRWRNQLLIGAFNDHHATTLSEVVSVFQRAIALAKEQECRT